MIRYIPDIILVLCIPFIAWEIVVAHWYNGQKRRFDAGQTEFDPKPWYVRLFERFQ
jgi:hypothetical protein